MCLVQYIVVRGDLKWPIGALIAQGCHASVSAIVKYMNDESTQKYISDLNTMRKVVLKAESESQLTSLCDTLDKETIGYVLWKEHPENVNTCIATVPRDRNVLKPFFKEFKLFN